MINNSPSQQIMSAKTMSSANHHVLAGFLKLT